MDLFDHYKSDPPVRDEHALPISPAEFEALLRESVLDDLRRLGPVRGYRISARTTIPWVLEEALREYVQERMGTHGTKVSEETVSREVKRVKRSAGRLSRRQRR